MLGCTFHDRPLRSRSADESDYPPQKGGELGHVLEAQARARHLDFDYAGLMRAYHRAHQAYRREGTSSPLHVHGGDWAAYRGWVGRAVSLLEQTGVDPNEHGWASWLRPRRGGGFDLQKRPYEEAIATTRRCRDGDLEMRGPGLARDQLILRATDATYAWLVLGVSADHRVASGAVCGDLVVDELSPLLQFLFVLTSLRRRSAPAVFGVLVPVVMTVWLYATHPNARVFSVLSPDMSGIHPDFDTFWRSAVALTRGEDLYATPARLLNLNPPLVSVLFAPFAAVSSLTGYRLFVGLTVVLVVGAVLAVARELCLPVTTRVLVAGAVLVSSPLHNSLVLGQVYGVLLVGLTAGWIAERRGRPRLAAALYGVMVALKPSLAPVLLLSLVLRRWAPFLTGVLAAGAATLVGALVAGWDASLEWVRIARDLVPSDSVDNASLPGLAVRFGLPAVAGTAAGLAVLGGTIWWIDRHRERVDPAGTAPWAMLAAGLLLSPIAWHNYSMLLWPGVLIVLASGRRGLAATMLAVAVIPVSWNEVLPPDGPVAAIGRSLYFVILLFYWLVLLALVRSSGPDRCLIEHREVDDATVGVSRVGEDV